MYSNAPPWNAATALSRSEYAVITMIGICGWRSFTSVSSASPDSPGIPDAIRDRIFFPLVSGREGGTGLGLTIAQTLISQHGGTIECASVSGHTVFTVLLPLSAPGEACQ